MTRGAPDTLAPATAWTEQALCQYDDPEVWFNERYLGTALTACRACPVRTQCLALAMAAEGGLSKHSRHGIYGGLTPDERARIAKNQARARARARAKTGESAPAQASRATEPCGTPAAYRRHQRYGERACEACRTADRLDRAERAARAKGAAS